MVGGARIMDGALLAQKVRAEVAADVAELRRRGVVPGLTVVLVGDDPASAVYVGGKEKASREAGMAGETIRLPATTSQSELLALVEQLNADDTVHGILDSPIALYQNIEQWTFPPATTKVATAAQP